MPKRIRIEPQFAHLHGAVTPEGDTLVALPELQLEPSWIERMAEQRKRWKEQDQARYVNPDKDPEAEAVWVVYAWLTSKAGAGWQCMGEKRKKTHRRKSMTMNRLFANLRQSLGLSKETPLLLISRQDDRVRRKTSREFEPPKHHNTLRPHKPPAASLKLAVLTPTPKRKIRKDTSVKLKLEKTTRKDGAVRFTFKTRYVAWGQMTGRSWYFLGAAEDGTRKGATAEMKQRWAAYSEIVVVEVKSLKYSLRSRIMDGRLRAGVSKDTPPRVK